MLDCVVQAADERFDALRTVPAHDARGDLVGDRIAQNGRMTAQAAHVIAHVAHDLALQLLVVEKGDELLPPEANHHTKTVVRREIQEPARRQRVGAHGVESVSRHLCEVFANALAGRIEVTAFVRTKRSVGNAAHPELLVADEQELAAHRGTGDRRRIAGRRLPPAFVERHVKWGQCIRPASAGSSWALFVCGARFVGGVVPAPSGLDDLVEIRDFRRPVQHLVGPGRIGN